MNDRWFTACVMTSFLIFAGCGSAARAVPLL